MELTIRELLAVIFGSSLLTALAVEFLRHRHTERREQRHRCEQQKGIAGGLAAEMWSHSFKTDLDTGVTDLASPPGVAFYEAMRTDLPRLLSEISFDVIAYYEGLREGQATADSEVKNFKLTQAAHGRIRVVCRLCNIAGGSALKAWKQLEKASTDPGVAETIRKVDEARERYLATRRVMPRVE